jgi:hypothetical protein
MESPWNSLGYYLILLLLVGSGKLFQINSGEFFDIFKEGFIISIFIK